VQRLGVPVMYVNQVGGNDELVFDGVGFVVEAGGALVLQQAWSAEDLSLWSPASGDLASRELTSRELPSSQIAPIREPEATEQLLRALVLGVANYARKCGFQGALLKRLVEDLASPEELVAQGADAALVNRVAGLVRRAEFKRRQAAPALKVSSRVFGSGWRMPIAAA
jgi:hypothetical protein